MLTVDFNELTLASGMRILDAGCGSGRHLCAAFRTPGVEVVGIDLKPEDLSTARGFLTVLSAEPSSRGWLLSRADVTSLPFREAAFDIVICSEVLEHVPDCRTAARELMRVLKPQGDLIVTVPRFLPERICWLLSRPYHREPGGHIRIFRKRQLQALFREVGARCRFVRYRHGLHAPYWWLKCLVGHKNDEFPLVRAYRKFLEWDIIRRPPLIARIDRVLNPLIGKSMILYLKKGPC
jgi:SAM-dependent methyltransferase